MFRNSVYRVQSKAFAQAGRTACRTRSLSSLPAVVQPGADEISRGALSARNLEKAVRHIHQDGLVVIEDAVSTAQIDKLNKKMVQDAKTLQAMGDKGPFNYNQGNLQQDAPPYAEHFSSTIFTNSIGTQVTSAVLGPKPKWTFCSGNSAMPPLPGQSPQRQPVHSDADFDHPHHPFALVLNVPLVSMKPENGTTELWLGTHHFGVEAQIGKHGERASGMIKEDILERQRAIRPPSYPEVKKGSIVVRDLRLWHAGMPNYSDDIRVMLAMIHFAPWYRNPMRLEFAEDVKPILEKETSLEIPADWIGLEAARSGYMGRGFGNSYDFDQAA